MKKKLLNKIKSGVHGLTGTSLEDRVKTGRDEIVPGLKSPIKGFASTVSTAGEKVQQAKEYVMPTVAAPSYLLQTSESAEDYEIYFDLDEVLGKIDAGILCRPAIQIFAGRGDLNREVLSERLTEAFCAQADEHEAEMKQVIERETTSNRRDLSESTERLASDVAFLSLLGVVGVATGGIGLLVMADMGIGSGAAGRVTNDITSMPGRMAAAAKESITGGTQAKLAEREVEGKVKSMKKALSRISLTMHDDLVHLSSSHDNRVYSLSADSPRVSDELPEAVKRRISELGGRYLPEKLQ